MVNNNAGWQVVKEYMDYLRQSALEALKTEQSVRQIRLWQHDVAYYSEVIGFIEDTIAEKNELLEHLDIDE